MKKHMVKLIAIVMTAVMVLSLVPVAALPEVNWPELLSVFGASSSANTEETEAAVSPEANSDANVSETEEESPSGFVTEQSITELTPSDDGFFTDDNGNIYVDSDGDGVAEVIKADVVEDTDDYDIADLIDGVTLGKDTVEEEVEYNDDSTLKTNSNVDITTTYMNEPYEPNKTENPNHPFLPGGAAWIDQSQIHYGAPATPTYPYTKWAANTSFLNTSTVEFDSEGRAKAWLFPDVNLIDENLWKSGNYETAATNGYAYNRLDPAYDKWGVTMDKNATSVSWTVNKDVYLSETPYLAYSVEQIDKAKTAVAVKIGTPTSAGASDYTYRWYILTDNVARPGINKDETIENSTLPAVQVQKNATNPTFNDAAYVDGAITACIDMTMFLPQIDTASNKQVKYRISEVRMVSSGKEAAARLNYLYFLNQGQGFISPMAVTGFNDLTPETTSDNSTEGNGWYNSKAITLTMKGSGGYGMKINTTASGLTTYTVDGQSYVDVIIPIRKWVNLAQDGRVWLMQVQKSSDSAADMMLSVWGNATGGTKKTPTYSGKTASQRNNEEVLFITGSKDNSLDKPYVVVESSSVAAHSTETVDSVYSTYFDYSGKYNYYDMMNSPYTAEGKTMVASNNTSVASSGKDAYGWTYLSSLRMCVPVGATYTVHMISTRNNLDNLNTPEGGYDGGTGTQPVVNINSTNHFTIGDRAAAFGPYVEASTFKTHDLLQRNDNKIVGGTWYQANGTGGEGTNYGVFNTAAPGNLLKSTTKGDKVLVLGIARTNSFDLGATLFDNGNGTYEVAWVVLEKTSDGTEYWSKVVDGNLAYDGRETTSGNWYSATTTGNFTKYTACETDIVNALKGNLVLTCEKDEDATPTLGTIGGTRVLIPKRSQTVQYNHNNTKVTDDTTVSVTNGTDVLVRANFWQTTDGNYSFRAAQLLPQDVTVTKTDNSATKGPYLHYDLEYTYNSANGTGSDIGCYLVLLAKKNGAADSTVQRVFIDIQNNKTSSSGAKIHYNNASVNQYGYIDLSTLFTQFNATKVDIVGYYMQNWYSQSNTGVYDNILRRLEIQYQADQYGDKFVKSGDKVVEGFNILDDAFNHANVTQSSNKYTDSTVGNRGWKINVETKTNTDASKSLSYRQTLGHLQVKIPSGTWDNGISAKVSLIANRSYSLTNYRYLYISYSMRDAENGIGVEDAVSNDAGGNGIAFAVRSTPTDGYTAIVSRQPNYNGQKINVTSAFNSGNAKYLGFYSSMNAAIDLASVGNFTSFNKIEFFLVNKTGATTDFYINYVYLSNEPPSSSYQTVASRKYYQTYYLMDNSMGSYARRFPTPQNPTGLVTTTDYSSTSGRNNPLLIERGYRFYEGTFYNGDSLASYKTAGGSTLSGNDAYKAIFFYQDTEQGNEKDLTKGNHSIDAYYSLDTTQNLPVEPSNSTDPTTVQGRWCYGRWAGSGEFASKEQNYLGYTASNGNVTGTLMQLYASANQVFMRNGLLPVLYQTNYDAKGGQMVYFGSDNIQIGESGIIANENNYYITSTMVLDYFTYPTTKEKEGVVEPWMYGFNFDGWHTDYDNYIDPETGNNLGSGTAKIWRYQKKVNPGVNYFYAVWSPKTGTVEGTNTTWDKLTHTISFRKNTGTTWVEWYPREATQSNKFQVKIPNVTTMVIGGSKTPIAGWVAVPEGNAKPAITEDSVIYTAGTTVTVTDNCFFYPVTMKEWQDVTADSEAEEYNVPHTITVTNGHLEACAVSNGKWFKIENGSIEGVVVKSSGTEITYTNIPHYAMVRAVATTANADNCWQVTIGSDDSAYSVVNTGDDDGAHGKMYSFTVASYQSVYQFSAYTNMNLVYHAQGESGSWDNNDHNMKDENGAMIFTAPKAYVQNRQMMFTSQFEFPESIASKVTNVKAGTLYTRSSQFMNIVGNAVSGKEEGTADYRSAVANALGDTMKFASATDLTLPNSVRYTPASEHNNSNQFYWMVTENKGNEVTYYARAYLTYTYNNVQYITYSDIIATAYVPKATISASA